MNQEYTPKARWLELQSIIIDQQKLSEATNLCNQTVTNMSMSNTNNPAKVFEKQFSSVITYRCRAELITRRWIEWDKKSKDLVNRGTNEDQQFMNLLNSIKTMTDKNIAQSYKLTTDLKLKTGVI